MTQTASENALSPLEQARQLFEFLAARQQAQVKPVRVHQRDDKVFWLGELPNHKAVFNSIRLASLGADDPAFTVDRVTKTAPPEIPGALRPWIIEESLDDPTSAPQIRSELALGETTVGPESETGFAGQPVVKLDESPEVQQQFQEWLETWRVWATIEKKNEPAQNTYKRLFELYTAAAAQEEEYELVLGAGFLAWTPEDHETVGRHVFTAAATLELDDENGRISVYPTIDVPLLSFELDMLEPSVIKNGGLMRDIEDDVRSHQGHPLDREAIAQLGHRVANTLDASGVYFDTDDRPVPTNRASLAFAPALIHRKRSQEGLVQVLEAVSAQLKATDEVPSGLLPLVDPDQQIKTETDTTPGAIVAMDQDTFLPLPVNEQQMRVIQAVDVRAQTVVQGPPGTGKTHTAAALLSHLLAQGKRVLVTAHTERALLEVRDKLPREIQPLAVSVFGGSRDELSELKVAVDRIVKTVDEYDSNQANQQAEDLLRRLDHLERKRSAAHTELIELKKREIVHHKIAGYSGKLAHLAQLHDEDRERYEWYNDFQYQPLPGEYPLSEEEPLRWLSLIRDPELPPGTGQGQEKTLDPRVLPDALTFSVAVEKEAELLQARDTVAGQYRKHDLAIVRKMSVDQQDEFHRAVTALVSELGALNSDGLSWNQRVINDLHAGRGGSWTDKKDRLVELISRAQEAVDYLGHRTRVEILQGFVPIMIEQSRELEKFLASGGQIKTNDHGQLKIGFLTSKVISQAKTLFEGVRVNGLPPTTRAHLRAFHAFVDAHDILAVLDSEWPGGSSAGWSVSLGARVGWHASEAERLSRLLSDYSAVQSAAEQLTKFGITPPMLSSKSTVDSLTTIVEATRVEALYEKQKQYFEDLRTKVRLESGGVNASSTGILRAIDARDKHAYAAEVDSLWRAARITSKCVERDAVGEKVKSVSAKLFKYIIADPANTRWDECLQNLRKATNWTALGIWLNEHLSYETGETQSIIHQVEEEIEEVVAELAALRAWSHAVAPERITGRAKFNLIQYMQSVRKLGKGMGKYAVQQRLQIRKDMDKCRSSVPVWIMPIRRIADQLSIAENIFDMILVDEASQAGLESIFLQYLAPKIVVIGDDKQVSPSAAGVDQQRLMDLADRCMPGNDERHIWADPKRSLFDEALKRYGGRITLREHRRCVPEIIGFSNQIAYEPDGVSLIPVRQYGADRLDPIQVVHVRDGYQNRDGKKVNLPEAEVIVKQIQACLTDPSYDGMTFGVISLVGDDQARAIEAALMEKISPADWKRRDLRCGNASDFQGSERNVIFLSMVTSLEPGKRYISQTKEDTLQRYNVAVSRAKDQLWLIHSLSIDALHNPDDLRHRLIKYCSGVLERKNSNIDGVLTEHVPDGEIIKPFDSLFEQRVFNRLLNRGFTVLPQFPAQGYSIDLVVIGHRGRLAIECDGDFWHGPEVYMKDLARQRDLERCGWNFFRVRESAFYANPIKALEPLWQMLEDLDIRPAGWDYQWSDSAAATLAEQSDAPEADVAVTGKLEEAVDLVAPVGDSSETELVIRADPAAVESEGFDEVQHYIQYVGNLRHPAETKQVDIIDGLIQILKVEGPILGEPLFVAYMRAANGRYTGTPADILSECLKQAVQRGVILQSNPLKQRSLRDRTYSLPGQALDQMRSLGGRSLDKVPPNEILALLNRSAELNGESDEDNLFRGALALAGGSRLTANAAKRFRQIRNSLMRPAD